MAVLTEKIYECDRCGERKRSRDSVIPLQEDDYPEGWGVPPVWGGDQEEDFILCLDCMADFSRWWVVGASV